MLLIIYIYNVYITYICVPWYSFYGWLNPMISILGEIPHVSLDSGDIPLVIPPLVKFIWGYILNQQGIWLDMDGYGVLNPPYPSLSIHIPCWFMTSLTSKNLRQASLTPATLCCHHSAREAVQCMSDCCPLLSVAVLPWMAFGELWSTWTSVDWKDQKRSTMITSCINLPCQELQFKVLVCKYIKYNIHATSCNYNRTNCTCGWVVLKFDAVHQKTQLEKRQKLEASMAKPRSWASDTVKKWHLWWF